MQRRRHPRLDYPEPIQVVVDRDSHRCRLLDIGHGGARIEHVGGVEPGAELKVFVELPIPNRDRSRFCRFAGTVVWTSGDAMGVVFDEVPLDSFAQLELGLEAIEFGLASR